MPRLGDILVLEHVITAAQRDAAVARATATGTRLGSAAIADGASADRVAQALARQHQVIAARDVQLASVLPSVRERVPEEVARRLCAVPLRLAPGTGELIVAVRDPDDAAVLAELAAVAAMPLRLAVAAEVRLRQALDVVYGGAAVDNPLRGVVVAPAEQKLPLEAARLLATARAGAVVPTTGGFFSRWRLERKIIGGVLVLISVVTGAYRLHHGRGDGPVGPRGEAGLRFTLGGDDWQGPRAIEAPGVRTRAGGEQPELRVRSAAYGRGYAHGDWEELVLATRVTLLPAAGGDPALPDLGELATRPVDIIPVLENMKIEQASCLPGAFLRDEPDMTCEGAGHWGPWPIEVYEIAWRATDRDLAILAWITYGSRKDGVAILQKAARSARLAD